MPAIVRETIFEQLRTTVYSSNEELGRAAAAEAVEAIRDAVARRGSANIILATGNSQLTFLAALRMWDPVPWDRVNVFHMDEYVGIDPAHPASFPLFLRRHLLDHVRPHAFYPVPNGPGEDDNLVAACRRYEALLRSHPADLCAMGIGENGHIAFNDPPYADFDDPLWVKVVRLKERSLQQQVGEGHFRSLDEVPREAISLTIPALLAAQRILVIVPEQRKAEAVAQALLGPLTEEMPASILRTASHAHLLLDPGSASLLP